MNNSFKSVLMIAWTLVAMTVHGATTNMITFGQLTSGSITSVGQTNFYSFNASAGDVANFALVRISGGQWPVLQLFSPDGQILFSDASAWYYAYVERFTLTNGGTYTLLVRDDGIIETFNYTLCVVKIPGPNYPEPGEGNDRLLIGERRAAQIVAGDLDAYSFLAVAGDSVTLQVTRMSGSGVNLVLQLYAPNGTLLTNRIGSTAARIHIPCVSQTGNFTVVCRDDGLIESFGYVISLSQSPGPPPSYDPDLPYVAFFRCMTNTVVRWPTNAAGFELEYSDIVSSANWVRVPPPYPILWDHHYVTNASSEPIGFFRLRRP